MKINTHERRLRMVGQTGGTPAPTNALVLRRDEARWIRSAYRDARRDGCPERAARRLVWDSAFAVYLVGGGSFISFDGKRVGR